MEWESMLFVKNHIPYLWDLSNSFSNSFIDFDSCEVVPWTDLRKNEVLSFHRFVSIQVVYALRSRCIVVVQINFCHLLLDPVAGGVRTTIGLLCWWIIFKFSRWRRKGASWVGIAMCFSSQRGFVLPSFVISNFFGAFKNMWSSFTLEVNSVMLFFIGGTQTRVFVL